MTDATDSVVQDEDRAKTLGNLDRLAQKFGNSLSAALARSIASGRGLDSVLSTIGTRLIGLTARLAAKPLTAGLSSLVNSLAEADGEGGEGAAAFARGGVFRAGRVTPFASGGIVAAPTYFPMAAGTGLMGEAGPEAIMPLARGADGRLGVAAGAPARPVSVHVTIATPDPTAFRRSEAQVAATLARAVARGQRAL